MSLGEKRLFVLVSVGGLVLLAALVSLALYLTAPRLSEFHPDLPGVIAVTALLGLAIVAVGLGLIALAVVTGRRVVFGQRVASSVVRIVFPLVRMLSAVVGLDRDAVKRSFIAVNNALVAGGALPGRDARVLLLLPHCLQAASCPHRITGGLIENCERCGQCVIAGLVDLARERRLALAVATGGTLARRVIGEVRPAAIIAVACEADLTAGIQDSYPLPVYGILNERPHGPCVDTTVDLENIRRAIGLLSRKAGGP
ncbi:MAG: DUF116 domain-containing protein [Candidatus Eisenbacteria bacterium]|nr:DUF116 domain-containing protein [Candidatus Eisenbacteria bacterium]